jgi:AP2-associated kinase
MGAGAIVDGRGVAMGGSIGGGALAGADEEVFDVDSFSKRYPSLRGLEMVETEIEIPRDAGQGQAGMRVRDV